MKNKIEQFNMVVVGTGGQGLITILNILNEAAVMAGCQVRTSELHGLAQRGGSVEVHIRFGEKIYSPLVAQGKADLIMGLETQEILRGCYFANSKTNFLINDYIVPIPLEKNLDQKEVVKNLKKVSENIELVPADKICREKLGTNVVAGVYLLSYASRKGMIPLKPEIIREAIKKAIPQKYLDLNLKTFELAKDT